MSQISRLLQEREFESIEEANAYVQERLMGRSLDDVPREETGNPLDRAQQIMYDAWEEPDRGRRIRLAEEALDISADCADAYNLLAEEKARSVAEARKYYEDGVQAGERALGPEPFEEDVGHFWGIFETRPYMRARAGLAHCLWVLGRREEAVEHQLELLRLNPNDNQGNRDVLLTWLLELEDDERAGELLREYEDDGSANWLYSRALWLFRREGESDAAEAALREALEQNEHVPAYLLGRKKIPGRSPSYVGWRDDSEAKAYAADAVGLWKDTAGARGWLLRIRQRST